MLLGRRKICHCEERKDQKSNNFPVSLRRSEACHCEEPEAMKESLSLGKIVSLRCSETKSWAPVRRSWQPVIPGKAVGHDSEPRKKNWLLTSDRT
jgi:hypothetical protein